MFAGLNFDPNLSAKILEKYQAQENGLDKGESSSLRILKKNSLEEIIEISKQFEIGIAPWKV